MYSFFSRWFLIDLPRTTMLGYTSQQKADHVMIEGVVRLLFPMLKNIPRPWTFTRTNVNDFSEIGSARSWEDQDWTLIVRTTQYILGHILIE